jgi:choloylglycine hydrolase
MCTAISYKAEDLLFGRNLDVSHRYGEKIIITPRNFTLSFRKCDAMTRHYSMIGIGIEHMGYPLYFDGVNEYGLCIAGLNFVGNAHYFTAEKGKINITPYEFIPYVLGRFKSVKEALGELGNLNLIDIPFSRDIPLAELHWMIADKSESVVIEQTKAGLRIYENKLGVLTNNPPFPFHKDNLSSYINLTSDLPDNRFSSNLSISPYSNGVGAFGMPGDLSSSSRFIRAVFYSQNSAKFDEKAGDVYQLFHILSSVSQIDGAVRTADGYERTEYSAVMDPNSATYYYRTYENSEISAVKLCNEDQEESILKSFPLKKSYEITYQN